MEQLFKYGIIPIANWRINYFVNTIIAIELLQFGLVNPTRVLLLGCLDVENTVNTKLTKISNIRVIQWIRTKNYLLSINFLNKESIEEVSITLICLSVYDEDTVGVSLQT